MTGIDIDIAPKLEALRLRGLSEADFNEALQAALERLDGTPTHQLPTPLDIPLLVAGEQHRLGDLALIDVTFESGLRHARL